jgi:hypothetical protein
MAHGRPAVRDVCWDGRAARFIDLERFRLARRAGLWQAEDVVMFAQTAFTLWLAPVKWLAAGLSAVRPGSRELRAVGLTLARLRRA